MRVKAFMTASGSLDVAIISISLIVSFHLLRLPAITSF